MSPHTPQVLSLGGLHVIGTNLHDSRRIDDQLRGRAGRQGDPGSSHFFLSLDDRIFRLFGGERVKVTLSLNLSLSLSLSLTLTLTLTLTKGLLDLLRVPEDQPIESPQVARVVAKTQEGVERYYFELRQKLSDFDGVLAFQRDATYAKV